MPIKISNVAKVPTEKATNLTPLFDGDNFMIPRLAEIQFINSGGEFDWTPQHLYFTTDDVIKSGDWMIYVGNGSVERCDDDSIDWREEFGWAKIVASTDEKLIIEGIGANNEVAWREPIPKPSEYFIKLFCQKGGVEQVGIDVRYDNDEIIVKSGEVILTILEKGTLKSYSKDEVSALVHKAINELTMPFGEPQYVEGYEIKKWLMQNLK